MALFVGNKILPTIAEKRKSAQIEREAISQELLQLVTTSDDDESEIVIKKIKFLIQEGADPNYASKENGETILHKVAANWGTDLADLIVENVMNIDVRDKYGRTPLHAAACSNNSDMVQWLIEYRANVELKTRNECQTPLHYAARFDSIEAIKILLHARADLEAKDYRGRTPLHLAVDLYRSHAADYLISLPEPAQIRVTEQNGDMAISAMIKTMPKVAYKALDQLHQIDLNERKELFILSYLEPDRDNNNMRVKSPLATTVAQKQRMILAHPVMQALIEAKWKYIRIFFYVHLALYMLFLLIWSGLIVYPTAQEQHIYTFPRDVYRLFFQFILIMLFALMILEETLVTIISIKRHWQFRLSCKKKVQEEFNTLIMNEQEREYLKENLIHPSYIPDHAKEIFTVVGFLSELLTCVVVIMHVADIGAHTIRLASWVARMAAFATILLWIRLIRYLRAIPSMGSLIAVIVEIKGDIFRYFLLATIIFIPYVLSFWIIFGGPVSANNTAIAGSTRRDLSTPYHVAVMGFRITLIDSYPYDDLRMLDEWITLLLIAPYIILLGVIGINLFIALLSNTFQKVQDDALANSLLQWATLITSLEEELFCCFYTEYYGYIRKHCNPLVKKYKEDGEMLQSQALKSKDDLPEDKDVDDADLELAECIAPEIAALESRVNANINTLKQEITDAVSDVLKKEYQEPEMLSFGPGGINRTYSRGFSRKKKKATYRDKEWERKLQSTYYTTGNN